MMTLALMHGGFGHGGGNPFFILILVLAVLVTLAMTPRRER